MTDDYRDAWESAVAMYRAQKAENDRLRGCLQAIMKATTEGRVCDDVAWFDGITTLHDYCDIALNQQLGGEGK